MINVEAAKSNLLIHVIFVGESSNIVRKLILLFSSQTEALEVLQSKLSLPWIDFKKCIFVFGEICKSNSIKVEFDDFSKKLIEKYLEDRDFRISEKQNINLSEIEITEILNSEGFDRKLTDEQVRDLVKILSLKHGANFSVPGAGKTTTLLALFIILRHFSCVSQLFVIAPRNAFISWEEEIYAIFRGKFSPIRISNLTYKCLKESSQETEILLINYEKLRKDVHFLFPFFLERRIHLVLDESHRIKGGINNLSYNQIDRLADLSIRRDILSGTPLPQSYVDIQPQFNFLWRDDILPYDVLNTKEDISESINNSITRLFVRTTKDELGLRPPTFNYLHLDMGPIQNEIYGLLKSEAARKLSGLSRDQISYLRTLGSMTVRLMQAATNPMLLGSEDEYYNELLEIPVNSSLWEAIYDYSKFEKPKKFEVLKTYIHSYLNEDKSNKVVLWTYFIKNIKLLEKVFFELHPTSIYGAINTGSDESINTREGRIRLFHDNPECKLLIANPQACGEGINLHRASHHAIYLDRSFNAAFYLQSVDRIHRLGLSNDIETRITFLIANNTIDEIIAKRLNEKTKRMADVLNDHFLRRLALDPEDIELDEAISIDNHDADEIVAHLVKQ